MRVNNWLLATGIFVRDLFHREQKWFSSELAVMALDAGNVNKVYSHNVPLRGFLDDLDLTLTETQNPPQKVLLTGQKNTADNGTYLVHLGMLHGQTAYRLERSGEADNSW